MTTALKVLIVEDEFLTADSIREHLIDIGHEVVGMARDAEEALHILENKEPTMAILDMNIQGARDGIWLAQQINSSYRIPFIFLTAYSDDRTVSDAMDTKPYGYLVKPFKKSDIYTALEVAHQNFIQLKGQTKMTDHSTPDGVVLNVEDFLFVKEKNAHIRLSIREIMYLKSELKYVEIYTEKKKYLLRYTLSELLLSLPSEMFIQVHRSYVVNKQFVNRIGPNYVEINGVEVPLSLQRKEHVLKEFKFL